MPMRDNQEPLTFNMRKGPWLGEEDELLVSFVSLFGQRKWDFIAAASGLKRSGKSCRLRWLNYLRPNLKRGQITEEEEQLIIQLHHLWGNKWAKIARRLPGRTDNEIKNYWRTHLRKKTLPQPGGDKPMQELLSEKEEGNSWSELSVEDWKSIEENNMATNSALPSNSSGDGDQYYELANLMNSPFENCRLYNMNWISESSPSSDYYHNEITKLEACECYDSCLCCISVNGEDGDNVTVLDSMGSLWDLT